MNKSDQQRLEQRVLILAPTGKDAQLSRTTFEHAGIRCQCCFDINEICSELNAGAGAVLLPEEAVVEPGGERLVSWLRGQAHWSDLPFLILARSGANSYAVAQALDLLGNVTVLERPTRIAALVSSVRTALRARQRQYQLRDQLAEREAELRSREILSAIVESSDDAIIGKTLDGQILTWNAGAERLFGYTAAEAIGRPISMLLPAERLDEEPALLDRLRRGERILHFETVRITKDGRRIDVALTVSPVRNEEGKVVAASTVVRDVTQQKETEAALRDADRRKDEFLAILAHELRNPLAPIRNSIHILRLAAHNDPTSDRVSEMLERQVNHMVRLVDDLLEMSRITRGTIELRKELIEAAAVVRSAVEASRPLVDAGHHQLAVLLPSEPLLLEGDSVRLSQVITNLLNNSAKYTDEGGQIWLTVRREDDRVCISVRDSGAGIPREMLGRVFELFARGDRSDGRGQGGLGIGLTLAKRIVELHGGDIRALSAGAGLGSEFILRLPQAAKNQAGGDPGSRNRPESPAARRILVVDDNRDAAESLAILLKMLGNDVQVAYSGAQALNALPSFRPAVILLDIGMPEMDGHEVARRIRQQSEYRETKLIAVSGWGQLEDRQRSRMAGFDFHLIKPAAIADIEALLQSIDNPGGVSDFATTRD